MGNSIITKQLLQSMQLLMDEVQPQQQSTLAFVFIIENVLHLRIYIWRIFSSLYIT